MKQRTFNPSLFIREAEKQTPDNFVPRHVFNDFNLARQLKSNIVSRGYSQPTPIQDEVIAYLLEGKDVMGMARTGTGKTAAFLIPLINKVFQNKTEKVLIVAPTRELAVQIDEELRSFTRNLYIFSVVCIGGASIGRQISQLKRRPNFVIGTPGRLKDLEARKMLYFPDYSSIVLDEVDRMLDMGFMPDVKHIVSRLPQKRQSLFFSATMPDRIRGIANSFLQNPVCVSIKSNDIPVNVVQDIVRVNGGGKVDLLYNLLTQKGFDKVLVFGRTKHGIEKLVKNLKKRGFRVASIHGNKTQNQRQASLQQFKQNKVQVLLATDIASRGLDINNVTHVINYDLPESYEDYIHRIGRTGRIGKKGTALTFVD